MSDEVRNVKFRRAPNGKIYAVYQGRPICDSDGQLCYFDTEAEARDFLERYELVVAVSAR